MISEQSVKAILVTFGWFIRNDTTPPTEAIYHSMIQKRTVKCDRPTYLTGPRATTKRYT